MVITPTKPVVMESWVGETTQVLDRHSPLLFISKTRGNLGSGLPWIREQWVNLYCSVFSNSLVVGQYPGTPGCSHQWPVTSHTVGMGSQHLPMTVGSLILTDPSLYGWPWKMISVNHGNSGGDDPALLAPALQTELPRPPVICHCPWECPAPDATWTPKMMAMVWSLKDG